MIIATGKVFLEFWWHMVLNGGGGRRGMIVKNLEVIRMTSTGELGSLEDVNPEKRKKTEEIRKMRLQAHKQTSMRFSIARTVIAWFSNLSSAIGLMLTKEKRQTQCEINGHSVTRFGYYGCVPKCRFCGAQINDVEELQSVR